MKIKSVIIFVKTISIICLAFILVSCNNKENKVLIIGFDGCRPDSFLKANTPKIDSLWKNGAYSFNAKTDGISSSGICWTGGMLTGVWHEKHNVISNSYKDSNIKVFLHFFRRVKHNSKIKFV